MIGQDKRFFESRGEWDFEREKESREGVRDFGLAFWKEERQSSPRGKTGLRDGRKEKAFYRGEAQ
jgi:hypothetical protein